MVGSSLLANMIARISGVGLLSLLIVFFFYVGVRAFTPKTQKILNQDRKSAYATLGKAIAINFIIGLILMFSMLFLLFRIS